MDVNAASIKLHPDAKNFLFKHYRKLMRIFRDVLGLLEIDYLAIGLMNSNNQLLFFSSQPSIESNLIEHNLWHQDPSYQKNFFQQNKVQYWDELYPDQNRLRYYKQDAHGFSLGLAIPALFDEYRVVYSFALKSSDEHIKKRIQDKTEMLTNIGRFCLKNILNEIPLPDRQRNSSVIKPNLKLVINNQVNYENNT